jgi:hypothetical protein
MSQPLQVLLTPQQFTDQNSLQAHFTVADHQSTGLTAIQASRHVQGDVYCNASIDESSLEIDALVTSQAHCSHDNRDSDRQRSCDLELYGSSTCVSVEFK